MAVSEKRHQLIKYVDPNMIHFLSSSSRNEVLYKMVDALSLKGVLLDSQEFYNALIHREDIVSTGIGLGVAIPHAKLEGYKDFFVAIGLIDKPGIDWNSLDGTKVRLVFMIGGPKNAQSRYLSILSALTEFIRDEEVRRSLLFCHHAKEVIQIFERS